MTTTRIRFTYSALGAAFAPGVFDHAVGGPVKVQVNDHEAPARLVAYEIINDGAAVVLTIEIDGAVSLFEPLSFAPLRFAPPCFEWQ